MMATKTKLPMINELVLALLAKKYAGSPEMLAAVKENPRKALELRDDSLQVKMVQNTAQVLHVCVPDYAALQTVKEQQLAQISAGTSLPGQTSPGSGAYDLAGNLHTSPQGQPESYIPLFTVGN